MSPGGPTCSALALLAVLACGTNPSAAGYFACALPDGGTQFQDQPCAALPTPASDVSRAARRDSDRRRASAARPPAGIDESWFERPADVAYEPYCDERGCECGALERPFETGLPVAVADALFMDGAWHRYDSSVIALANATPPTDSFAARTELEDAACDVLMSQRTLTLFATQTLSSLRRRAQDAADLGRDEAGACDGFSDIACDDHQAYMLYQRMQLDLQALSFPRQ